MINLSKQVLNRRMWNAKSYKKVVNGTLTAIHNMGLLSQDKNTIDVGAAAGLLSTFFAKNSKEVYCYEPSPSFPQTQKIEKKFKNVIAFNCAVGNHTGQTEFWIDDRRLSQNGFLNPGWGQKTEVHTVKLDDQDHHDVGFVKIDTEGTELDVLRGMESTLTRDHPSFMIEIWDKNCKYPLRNIFEYMFNNDYATYWYHIKKKKIMYCRTVDQAVKDVSIEGYPHDADFIFVHHSRILQDYTRCLIRPVTG